ncbi:MAG: ACP phosphodiesterase, partial [Xanthomonadales bacterium]|nr:ACP phosphodiesterase [Xanthomonadales bacterium]
MNYLAHAWLSGADPAWIVGGFLGDHVRGEAYRDFPTAVARSILLHRRIDGFVDRHPAFVAARAEFSPPHRRFAGILLDLAFDHLLARRWRNYSQQPLDTFSARCHWALDAYWSLLPESLRRFTRYARHQGLPAEYRSPAVMQRALAGISSRLSRANPLAESWPVVVDLLPEISPRFEELMVDLIEFAAEQ